MARKKGGFGRILVLGGLVAAGAAAYQNREKILGFIEELTGNAAAKTEPDIDVEIEVEAPPAEKEADIVIDRSGAEPKAEDAPATAEKEASKAEEAPKAAENEEPKAEEQPAPEGEE